MARLVHIRTNAAAARSGDWVGDLPDLDGFRVRLRPLAANAAVAYSTDLYAKVLGRKAARNLRAVPPEIANYVNARALIDVCVSDWEGLSVPVDASGAPALDDGAVAVGEKELPFTKELIETILLEPAEKGFIVTDPAPGENARRYKTPDGRQARESMRGFLQALVVAAARVDEADDEGGDDEAGAGGDAEKKTHQGLG